jgi:glucose/arabinose dehydrogenase
MSSEADIIEDCCRQLGALGELSLAMAKDVHAAAMATKDTADVVRVAAAFAKMGRCLRLTIALRARLARGEALSAVARAGADRDEPLDAELAVETERSDRVRAERLDHESHYERLPDGDPVVVARTIAHDLIQVARDLSAPKGRDAKPIVLSRDYAALCRDLVANDPQPPDRPPVAAAARGPP